MTVETLGAVLLTRLVSSVRVCACGRVCAWPCACAASVCGSVSVVDRLRCGRSCVHVRQLVRCGSR